MRCCIFLLSISLNAVLTLHYVVPSVKNRLSQIEYYYDTSNDTSNSQTEYHYDTSNPRYSMRLSMFELFEGDADIVFLGDSLTERANWNELYPNLTTLNRGIGGDTTEGILMRIDEVMTHHPKMIVIMAGLNDLAHGISIDSAAENMQSIIERVHALDENTMIIVESVIWAQDVDQGDINRLNSKYEELCINTDWAEYIDVSAPFLDGGYLYGEDGIHLNGEGYKTLVDMQKIY